MNCYSVFSKTLRFTCLIFVIAFGIVTLIASGGGGSGDDGSSISGDTSDNDNMSDDEDCYWDYMVGPKGAVLTLDDPANPGYGVTVEVAPGELDDCRTFELTDDYFNVSVTPYLPSGFLSGRSGSRRDEGIFEIRTSYDPPYDVELTMTFPLSDTDLNVAYGEVICAFYFDKKADSWRFVLPESIDKDAKTMTVVTTYREVWNWGRVDVMTVDEGCLEPALKERMGSDWDDILTRIEDVSTEIDDQNISYTSCDSLRYLQGVFLQDLKEGAEARLVAARSSIDPLCGYCDPLSEQFKDELYGFIKNKMSIPIYEMLADNAKNWLVEFAMRIKVIVCYVEIIDYDCNYVCVHNVLGVGFWMDFAEYQLTFAMQYLIDWYIGVSGMNCPL